MVETRIVDDAEFRSEVELTQAMRQGLRELQRRGEIAPLLSPRRAFWSTPRVALAASVATVALGAASFLFFVRHDQAPPGILSETLRFAQTRSAANEPDARWVRPASPGRLSLRFDVGLEPARAYAVRIERLAAGSPATLLETTAATSDGEVAVEVEGASFTAGDYRITLRPEHEPAAEGVYVYRLLVTER